MRWMWLIGVVLAGTLTACGSEAAAEPSATAAVPVSSPVASIVPASAARTTVAVASPGIPSNALQLVGRAKQDVATRVSVPVDQVQVVSVTRVAWPDSSLGCPKPGQMYSQIVTPGYKIVLQADGTTYEYHTDLTQRVTACTK